MVTIRHIQAERIVAPTNIAPADYVINPYRGCQFGCYFCYAQWNKFARKQSQKWGSFVDVKTNAAELCKKELQHINTGTVMIGATTEVYQPVEKKYRLTRSILSELANHDIRVILLTRSDLIVRDIDILKQLTNVLICFTLNTLDNAVIRAFEPAAPTAERRIEAIRQLSDAGIPVYLHIGPYLPALTDHQTLMQTLHGAVSRIDVENLNLKMVSWDILSNILNTHFPHLTNMYDNMYHNPDRYTSFWDTLKAELLQCNEAFGFNLNIYFHPFDSYFPQPEHKTT